jgi:hypothetical protein
VQTDADLQLAGIKLEHRGIRDPRMALEALAYLIDVKKYERGGASDVRGRQHFLSADVMIAGERDRRDPKACCIGDRIARVLEASHDARNVIPFDGAVAGARENDEDAGGDACAARPLALEQGRPAVHDAGHARFRSRCFGVRDAARSGTSRQPQSQCRDPL